MADGATIKFNRRDAMFAKLRRNRPALTAKLTVAVKKSADEHAALSRRLAPFKTGELRRGIDSSLINSGVSPKAKTEAAGGDDFHGIFVEKGSKAHTNRGIFTGTKHPGTDAQPFFFTGYRLLRTRARRRIARAITAAHKMVRP